MRYRSMISASIKLRYMSNWKWNRKVCLKWLKDGSIDAFWLANA